MLSQLIMLFGFFSLILVMVYWINRAVSLFDQLIADGQSAVVFLEFTALSLPNLVRLVLPIAAFAGSVYVTNRMANESELVVVQATGYSPFRLARPVFVYGVFVALLMSLLVHLLVPLSITRLNDRTAEVAQNATVRILTEGQFMEPTDGVTVYIREITPNNELRNLFLSDQRDPNSHVTYTASRAYVVRTDTETQLIMVDGLAQTLNTETNKLFTTSFDDFAYNVGDLMNVSRSDRRSFREVSTLKLLSPTPSLEEETRRTEAELKAAAHDRISQSLLALVAAMLGFSALMIGGYSRFGVWQQIVFAIFLIIVIKGLETVGLNIARQDPDLWIASYLAVGVGLVIVLLLLFFASKPSLFRRRVRATA
ncbi:lipopolysaccharide export system permease protein [Cognatiyoonia sediminum]|uniref:Lipopolysaccharide export system permease protein n=1 Tax=Cognatiyoonia sediminum TaxID=1508389 RepID=A0A1M5LXE4_9RHOB|nr:LPS export ABC transporter permease LptF [Cognatiyoonia sediminum]SHG69782.1 lipopolysaccharide export system permease protein [Cognatiyoonia sediminum]